MDVTADLLSARRAGRDPAPLTFDLSSPSCPEGSPHGARGARAKVRQYGLPEAHLPMLPARGFAAGCQPAIIPLHVGMEA